MLYNRDVVTVPLQREVIYTACTIQLFGDAADKGEGLEES
jgi:hypothetical protein